MKIGDEVIVRLDTVVPEIAEMLSGRVGIIVNTDPEFWDFIVQFQGTDRPGGLFGFVTNQLIPAYNS